MGDTFAGTQEVRVPWKESRPVTERMTFVKRLEQGERMAELCREYGISRKTGYKYLERFRQHGPEGLFDYSRAPIGRPQTTSEAVVKLVLDARRAHPTWGPKKLRAWLTTKQPGVALPATSTMGEVLRRHGLVQPRKRRRTTSPYEAPLTRARAPHDVWCADFKGQFRLGCGKHCYPLTITDRYSRTLLCCEALESTNVDGAMLVFEKVFREHGLPRVIRTDNGVPFASKGLLGLSRLAVRWLRLGVWPERIALGHPEQNGQHERMHLVLKQETTRPASHTLLAQQERFDRFLQEYNHERPHEALEQKTPASLYCPSSRRHPEVLGELDYSLDDLTAKVEDGGNIRLKGPNGERVLVFVSSALRGERVGLREIEHAIWRVTFADVDLGTVDARTRHFEPRSALGTVGADPND
ncbi:MAG TPA: IS481 family transposase [Kofleriaceae bacterium]|jgi:transposase InsO family protein|nr:IS481 family transposase [Kofleriaceae bacterium]